MRYSYFLLLLLGLSCKTSDQTAVQNNVQDYLSKNLDDNKSYEPVKFGTLDSNFSQFEGSERWAELEVDNKRWSDSAFFALEMAGGVNFKSLSRARFYTDEASRYNRLADSTSKLLTKEEAEFKPEFVGYKINHSYRAKNKMGGVQLYDRKFLADKNLQVFKSLNNK